MLDWGIVAARLLQYTGSMVLFGTSLFYLYGLVAESYAPPSRMMIQPLRILCAAAGLALAASLAWLMAETASMTGDTRDALRWSALQSVVSDTRFGAVAVLRMALLAASVIALLALPAGRRQWVVQTLIGGLVIGSFAWTGHGAMDAGPAGLLHIGSDVLHLLAAGVWIGALVQLCILVQQSLRTQRDADRHSIAGALERFSGIGPAMVAVLVLTGLINSWFLIGPNRWRSLFITAYGFTLFVKIVLFALMLAHAAVNRFLLSPALSIRLGDSALAVGALRSLRFSLITETVLGLLVIAAVALLGTLEPPVSLSP